MRHLGLKKGRINLAFKYYLMEISRGFKSLLSFNFHRATPINRVSVFQVSHDVKNWMWYFFICIGFSILMNSFRVACWRYEVITSACEKWYVLTEDDWHLQYFVYTLLFKMFSHCSKELHQRSLTKTVSNQCHKFIEVCMTKS